MTLDFKKKKEEADHRGPASSGIRTAVSADNDQMGVYDTEGGNSISMEGLLNNIPEPQVDNIPEGIRSLKHWVGWRGEPQKLKDGTIKITKPPVSPSPPWYPTDGNNPNNWLTFPDAMAAYEAGHKEGGVHGIGFAFSNTHSYIGLDLDDCVSPDGELSDLAWELIDRWGPTICTYTERSISGTGIHQILGIEGEGKSSLLRHILRLRGEEKNKINFPTSRGKVELFLGKGYMTISGDVVGGMGKIATVKADAVRQLIDELEADCPKKKKEPPLKVVREPGEDDEPPPPPVDLVDDELLDKARRAKNGAKFGALFDRGDLSLYEGDESRADQGLCALLALWTSDEDQIDRLFRQSTLYRIKDPYHLKKWDRVGRKTIQKVIAKRAAPKRERPSRPLGDQARFEDEDEAQEEWPSQLEPVQEARPLFPLSALPLTLRSWAEAVAESLQVPVDLPAIFGLAACSAALAGKIKVKFTEGWAEPINVYLCVIALSGEGKTPVVSSALQPLYDHEKELTRQAQHRILRAKAELAYLDRRQKKLMKSESEEGAIHELTQLETKRESLQAALVSPRILAEDCTPEKLDMLLAEQRGCINFVSAEGGMFDQMAGQYSKTGLANLDVYLKMYSGEPRRVDRVGRPSLHISRATGTIAVAVQPIVLKRIIENQTFQGRGLIARFLVCEPESMIGRRSTRRVPIPPEITRAYEGLINHLCKSEKTVDGSEEEIYFSPESREAVYDYHALIESRLKITGDLFSLADWCSKLKGALIRLSGLICHIERRDEVSLTDVAQAISLCDYFVGHAKLTLRNNKGSEDIILKWIKEKNLLEFSSEELRRSVDHKISSAEELREHLKNLCECGYLKIKKEGDIKKTKGRPRSPTYLVNPEFLK